MNKISPDNKDTILAAIYNFMDRENKVNQRAVLFALFGEEFSTVISRNVGHLQDEGYVVKDRINNNIIITITPKGVQKAKEICVFYGDIFNQNGKKELELILQVESKQPQKKALPPQEIRFQMPKFPAPLDKDATLSKISDSLDVSIRKAMKEELGQYIKSSAIDDLVDDVVNLAIDKFYETFDSIDLFQSQKIKLFQDEFSKKLTA